MGACLTTEGLSTATKEEIAKNKAINAQTGQKIKQQRKVIKLILLGAGDSGKSTILKQIIHLYGIGFDEEKLILFTKIVYNNIVKSIKELVENSDILGEHNYEGSVVNCCVSQENQAAKQAVIDLKDDDVELDVDIGKHIEALWKDPGIQNTLLFRSSFNLLDNAEHFFEQINTVCSESYIPSYEDALRVRYRTSGIVETDFEFKENIFKIYDVGGQRNERKKWIHGFESVKAVMFVAAVSEYDQMLFEDQGANRMTETLNLFEEICNSRWFKNTAMILFLNKSDILKEKINRIPITVLEEFSSYKGPQADFEKVCDYIGDKFEKRSNLVREIYTHITCATDTSNVDHVFNAVRDIVVRQAYRSGGLVE